MSSAGLSIGELVGSISLNDQFSGPLDKVAKAIGISSQSFSAIAGAAGIAAGALVGVTGAVVALGTHGAEVSDVRDSFEQLTGAAGATASEMLGALREGTLGTISNFDLMKASNGVLASGMVTTADQMKTLAAGAKLLADRTGGDTAAAFDTLTSAMATGRTTALKSMGVTVESDNAIQAYANSVHKSVKDLTDQEVATAKANAVLGALKQALDANGPATADFGDRITQGKVAVQNFVDNVAVAVANSPALAVVMDTVSTAIQDAFGGDNQQAVQTISEYIQKFAVFMVDVAQVGVNAARFITDAFNGTKLIFNLVLEALFTGIGQAADTLADLADKAKALPVVGAAFVTLSADLHSTADMANSLALGFKEQGDAAYDSAVTATQAFDAVDATLAKLQTSLETVDGAQVKVATTAQAAGKAHADAAGEAKHYAEVMNGLSEDDEAWRARVTEIYDSVRTSFTTLMNDITTANMTKDEAQMASLAFSEQQELASLALRQQEYGVYYEGLVALTQEKYRVMTEQAQGHFASVELAAEAAGFQTRAQQQQTADRAKQLFDDMTASGKFSSGELTRAHKAYTDAVEAMDKERALTASQQFDLIAGAAKTLISAVFGKGKVAAIATAIIDTAAAVVKALASAPPPLNYGLAAAVGLAGLVQINKIRSQEVGFAQGTPDTMFVDFGRETVTTLHGPEAVVNYAQGETLADMVLGAVRLRDNVTADEIRGLRQEMADDRKLLPYRLISAAALARA